MVGVTFLPVAVQLLNEIDVGAFSRLCHELRPALIVLDTQARLTVGAEENSAADMGKVVATLDRIRQTCHALVLVVHHEPRSGENLRGSTALEGAASTVVRVNADGPLVTLTCTKQKDAEPFEPLLLRRVSCADSAVLEALNDADEGGSVLSGTASAVLAVLRQSFGSTGASASMLCRAADLPERTFYRALNVLVGQGLVRNDGSKHRTLYVLTDAGQLAVLP